MAEPWDSKERLLSTMEKGFRSWTPEGKAREWRDVYNERCWNSSDQFIFLSTDSSRQRFDHIHAHLVIQYPVHSVPFLCLVSVSSYYSDFTIASSVPGNKKHDSCTHEGPA